MTKNQKWEDPEDNKEFEEDDVQNIHKKISLKNKNISEGLKNYYSEIKNNKKPLWVTKKRENKKSEISNLQKNAENFNLQKNKKVKIKKFLQTDNRDSLNSVIQSIDSNLEKNLFLYSGFDKILKLSKINNDNKKNYFIEKSIFFESLPICNSFFTYDSSKIILTFLKKSFLSIYDLEKEKSNSVYKLFNIKNNIDICKLNKTKNIALLAGKNNLTFFDISKNFIIEKNLQPSKIHDACFLDENKYMVTYRDFTVRLYDIRKSFKIPYLQKKKNCLKISANEDYLVFGNKNGVVEIFDNDFNFVKKFPQLTTEISDLSINNNYLAFSSKWKKNSVRVCNLKKLNLLPLWPNVKTRLDFVSKIMLDDNNRLFCGNSKGKISAYSLY